VPEVIKVPKVKKVFLLRYRRLPEILGLKVPLEILGQREARVLKVVLVTKDQRVLLVLLVTRGQRVLLGLMDLLEIAHKVSLD
jgi:hypothetical protein